ncbi:5177_t:CDS:2 [Paraglomus brasilianum]|uniref:5177_t:CDS:1 n=1 Tax=Paraglomus brasilianum TaxID=144538 RepID=A0A9N9DQR1_9GLOM|nr:5177_t:CDS:2 [Paraglomus brasilianum]
MSQIPEAEEDFYDPMPVDEFEDGLGRSLYQSQSSFNREGNSGQGAYVADESILQGTLHKGGHKHGQNTDKIVDQDFFNDFPDDFDDDDLK